MNFSIGPMSKNIVDSVLDYSRLNNISFTFIPSRRQIDYKSGYVNNWTTQTFCQYVKKANLPTISIQRDHGGPAQGENDDDDGILSLEEDCKYMDSIHIDPWKKFTTYEECLQSTLTLLEYCYKQNNNLTYEVGTEEAIFPISTQMLSRFLKDLKENLPPEIFSKLKFVVIQCGTQLLEKENIGHFDKEKLLEMLSIVKSYGLLAKEHNGDWVSFDIIEEKRKLGLQNINIAPEFGEIETRVILETLRENKNNFETFYKICFDSGKWKKWVSSTFEPENNKENLILICGHYVFSNPLFLSLLEKYNGAQLRKKIHEAIFAKLDLLHSISPEKKYYFDKN
jgi:hypothetical protein